MKIAVIGKGNVGSALERGFHKGGHDVRAVGREPDAIRTAGASADVIVLAVPFGAIDDVVRALGDTPRGKVLVDVTNPLTADLKLAVGFTTSGAEELQKKVPSARVVKAFNTVFAGQMDNASAKGKRLSVFVASDDAAAKKAAMDLARSIGFDPVDAGPLQNARHIEPLAFLNIQLAYVLGMGADIGFSLLH